MKSMKAYPVIMELRRWDSTGKSFVRVMKADVRKLKDKDFVQIWDLTSTCKFAKRHLTQRKKFYKEAQYPFTIEKVDWN